MTWSGADAEGTARWIYERAGFDPSEPPGPSKLAKALGLKVATAPKRGAWGHGCLVRLGGEWSIWLAPKLPVEHRAFAVAHELAEWSFRQRDDEATEALCDATAAAILAPRSFFAAQLERGLPDFSSLAAAFRTTESCVALRLGEVTGRPLALVSPGLVRVRGDDWSWPDADAVRRAAKAPERHGLTLVRLTDDRRRVVLLAA